jgi:hypothetical protein
LTKILKCEVFFSRTLLDAFLTARNKELIPAIEAAILARKALMTSSPPDFGRSYIPCAAVHPWIESCVCAPLPRFFTVFKCVFSTYRALNVVPMMLFNWHNFFKNTESLVSLQYSSCCTDFCVYRSEYLSGKFNTVGLQEYAEHLMFLTERPAAPVWTCQADIVSVRWTKLNHIFMVASYDLLFVGYYRIACSLCNPYPSSLG